MPRPVFGAADWWTFAELDDAKRFEGDEAEDALFSTKIAARADHFAEIELGHVEPCLDEDGELTWPTLEFLVSRGTKTVLMVRRRG